MTVEELEQSNIKPITYENVGDYIDKIFPEYTKSEKFYDNDSPYLHLGTLSLMALENLEKLVDDSELAERLVRLTNYILNNYNGELANLFAVEILEKLAETRKGSHLAKKFFTGEALKIFQDTTKFYGTPEFLDEYSKLFDKHL